MKLAVLITAKLEGGLETAMAWQERGAPGVTILRSQGIHSLRQEVERGDIELPMITMSLAAAMAHLIDSMDQNGMIALSVVEDSMTSLLVEVATQTLGDLSLPNNGILFFINVDQAYGVVNHSRTR